MRKPLRSSPLAGPALFNEGADETLASSTPNLSSLKRSEASTGTPPLAELPTSTPGLPVPPSMSKRASLINLVKRPLKAPPPPIPLLSPPSDSTLLQTANMIHNPLPPPPPSPRHHTRKRSRVVSISMTDLSSSFPLPPPSFPRALTAPSTSRRFATHPLPGEKAVYSSGSGTHKEENWLTSTPYGDTPRFSRLSLASPNIVLPVSAREAKRQSIHRKGGKRVSLIYPAAAVMPPHSSSLNHANPLYTFSASTPSLVARSRSHSDSSDNPTTPSASSHSDSGVEVVTDENDDAYEADSVDISLVSPRDFEIMSQDTESEDVHVLTIPRHSLVAEAPATRLTHSNSTWRLSMKRHRRSHAQAKKGTSFFFFGSGDSAMTTTSTGASSPVPSSMHSPESSYDTLETKTVRVATATALSPYEAALEAYDPRSEVASIAESTRGSISGKSASFATTTGAAKKTGGGTMRRFLRSISGRR